jgi:hypothetical protein
MIVNRTNRTFAPKAGAVRLFKALLGVRFGSLAEGLDKYGRTLAAEDIERIRNGETLVLVRDSLDAKSLTQE